MTVLKKTVFVAALAACYLPLSHGAVSLFSDNGNAQFDLDYGPNRGTLITESRFSGNFGNLGPDNINNSVNGLSVTWSLSGAGTSLATLDFELTNISASTVYSGLGYTVFVNPIEDFDDFFSEEKGGATFGATTDAGEPDSWEIDDVFSGNVSLNFENGSLDSADNCGAGCDLGMALGWDLGDLSPGEVAIISVGFSDDGSAISKRYLEAVGVNDPDTKLTLSGNVSVVPLPAALPLLGSALVLLAAVGRRRREV